MKTVLKFAGVISLVAGIVAIILFMTTPGVNYTASSQLIGGSTSTSFAGQTLIFGGENIAINWAGLGIFIALVCGLVLLFCGFILPIANVKAAKKFAGLINFLAACCLIAAGVFAFFIIPAFTAVNGSASFDWGTLAKGEYSITFTWIIAAIVSIAGGVFALLPTVANLSSKK